jgi:hypothetical protein
VSGFWASGGPSLTPLDLCHGHGVRCRKSWGGCTSSSSSTGVHRRRGHVHNRQPPPVHCHRSPFPSIMSVTTESMLIYNCHVDFCDLGLTIFSHNLLERRANRLKFPSPQCKRINGFLTTKLCSSNDHVRGPLFWCIQLGPLFWCIQPVTAFDF